MVTGKQVAQAGQAGPGQPHDPTSQRRFGRYVLVKKLATGGMAEIWLATQSGIAGFTRFVVIKKILSHLAEHETFVSMFLDEARTSAQLAHPNIVQINDLGNIDGTFYIAMEYIAGENLSAISWRATTRQEPISSAFAARIICDAAKALHYAHQLRGADGRPLEIVHRDISPQNILVTYEGEVKVVDFGIAKAASKTEHTRTGMLKGKFSYMSPEQCTGAPLDGRSDVFALGIVLYELCTGMRLFKHESELMILDMITNRDVVPPSQVVPNIPPELDAIILRALERSRERRYASAQEMQIALDEFLRKQPRATTSGDLGAMMRTFFSAEIEEKRKLIEAASKNELPPLDPSPEPAARAPNASTWPGAGGSVPGAGVPGPTFPGVTSPGAPPSPGAAFSPAWTPTHAHSMYAPAPPSVLRWLGPILALLTLGVIGLAAWIHTHRASTEVLPTRRGSIALDSQPPGARVLLDGRPLLDDRGRPRLTPVDLRDLEIGARHIVRLELIGHRALEKSIEMTTALDGQSVTLALTPDSGELEVSVVGGEPAEIYFGSERMGLGPKLKKRISAGNSVAVAAALEGHTCTASPSSIQVRSGETVEVSVRCERAGRWRSGRSAARADHPAPSEDSSGASAAPEKSPEPRRAESDCSTNPALPKGWVTIDTNPYSEIFVSGRKVGETPLAKFALPAGCTEFLAKSPSTGQEKRFRLETQPGSHQIYKIDL